MIVSSTTDVLAKRFGIDKAVDMLIEAGYTGIDFSMFDINALPFTDDYKEVAARIRAKADAAGVKFVQAHAPFGGSPERVERELIPIFPRAMEFCSLLGIPNIVIHPVHFGKYNADHEARYEYNMKMYRDLVPYAKQYGVKIAIENMWTRHPITGRIVDAVCEDPAELCRYYDDLKDTGCFTICLDVGHVALCNREPEDVIRFIGGDRLGCVHLHDVNYVEDNHTLPGVGRINLDRVCRALADVNYKGPFNLEADYFFNGFLLEHSAIATKFMCDASKIFAAKVEEYKAEKCLI